MKKALRKKQLALPTLKSSALLLLFFTCLRLGAQQVITIPPNNDPDKVQSFPLGSRPGFTRTHALYTSADLGASGSITAVSFYVNGTDAPASVTPVVIRLKNTNNTQVTASDYTTASTASTVVYSGNLTAAQLSNGSWITFPLLAPFDYAGYSLELLVETNTGVPESETDDAKAFNWSDYVSANVSQIWSGWTAAPPANTNGALSTYRPNVKFSVSPSSAMSFVSAQVIQNDAICSNTAKKQVIASLKIETQGLSTPLVLEALELNTNGTLPNTTVIQNAKVYYTGISPNFDTTVQYGSTIFSPASTFTVSGAQTLATGTNYVWVTYDVDPSAQPGAVLDAACTQVSISTVNYTPSVTAPAASVTIGNLYDFEAATNQGFSATALNLQPNQWQRGTPTGAVAPFSGTKCWKTNLTGNYATNSNYVLTTPPYVAQSAAISVSYKQWYRFITVNNIRATFEYKVNSGAWSTLNMIFNLAYESNSGNKWVDAFYKIAATPNDTVQFRWHFETTGTVTGAQGWFIDNFIISGVNTFNQAIVSLTASHPNSVAIPAVKKQAVAMIQVNVNGSDNPLTVTDLQLSTSGSSVAPGLIENARVFYTGNTNKFDTSASFGTGTINPSGLFTISGSQALTVGANYFWLTYDVGAGALAGDVLDAELLQLTASTILYTPLQTAPAGNLPVGRLYHFDAATADHFTAASLNTKPNQWQRGVPAAGPATAYSGTQCWGTNLSGNYTPACEYELTTPPYIAQSADVRVDYRQWYALSGATNIGARFQYKVNSTGTWTTLNALPATAFNLNSGNAWQEVFAQPVSSVGDTITFRWYFSANVNAAPAAGWYIDHFVIANATTFNQQYQSSSATLATGIPSAGGTNQPIIRLAVEVSGADSPVAVTSLDLATTGSTTTTGIIDAARVFYTGTNPVFDTTTAFGAAVNNPASAFTLAGNQTLSTGTNYFWLAYNIDAAAIPGDSFNGVFAQLTVDSVNQVPAITTSLTALYVGMLYNFDTTGNQGFETHAITGTLSEWKKGVPANVGPATSFSGTQCWATNLGANFTGGADYSLNTPSFIAQSAGIQAGFKQWYDVNAATDVDAEFQYIVNSGVWTTLYALDNTNYTISSDNKWQDILEQVSVSAGDTVQFRWRMAGEPWAGSSPGWYIDNFVVSGVKTFNQTYVNSYTETLLDILSPGTRNNGVLRIMVQTTGSGSTFTVNNFDLSTLGSTVGIIDSARLFYTGLSNVFDTTHQFGTTSALPAGAFSISGNQDLATGNNYFWLTYDLAQTAQPGDSVNAIFNQVSTGSGNHIPPFPDASGSMPVGLLYNFDTTSNQYFETFSLNGNPSEWQKGTPASGPSAAFSGAQCWGTNLGGNYGLNSNYLLQTPPYLAQSEYVSIKYQQWYELLSAYDQDALFQYEVNGSGTWNTINALRGNEGDVNSANKWERVYTYALVNTGDTIRFRWLFVINPYGPPAKGWYIDNFTIAGATRFNQAYLPSSAEQTIKVARPGESKVPVLKIPVKITGAENPLSLSSFEFNTTGTTALAGLISSAKVYYTGLTDRFDTLTAFGNAVNAPSGPFTVNGTQTLLPGTNYFWLTYDVGANAQINNILDAVCAQFTISSVPQTPLVTAPAGDVMIGRLYHFDTTSNQDFYTENYTSQPSEWQRGTPLNGPASAYSGTQCWGTNLVSDYTTGTEHALISAPYVATSSYVNINYKQWYEIITASSLSAKFQYQLNRTGTWNDLLALNNVDYEVNSGGKWEDVTAHVPLTAGDTVQFRWYFYVDQWASTAPGWYIDNFIVSGVELADLFKPTISYSSLQGTYAVTNRVLNGFAQISDESGIDTTAGSRPRIYYKKTTDADVFGFYPSQNNSFLNGWKYTEATNTTSPFSFVIDYSLLTSAPVAGDEIQYFVTAQDLYATPNVGAFPEAGFKASSVNNIDFAPSGVYTYSITAAPLAGYYRVGAGKDYTTITAAVADLNARGVNAPVIFALTDSVYNASTGETFPFTIKDVPGASASNYILVKTAPGRTVAIGSNNAIFKMEGSDFVTIDGADSATNNKNLTLTGLSTTPMIWIGSKDGVKGATHNTIKNCILQGSDQTKFGVFVGGKDYTSLTSPATAPNNYNRIAGNTVLKTQCAVAILGQSVTIPDVGNVVTGNTIGDATNPVSSVGILLNKQQQDTVSANAIRNITATIKGIDLGIAQGSYVAGIYVSQSKQTVVSHNNVSRFVSQTSSGSTLSGIAVDGKDHLASANLVANNFVSGGNATGNNTYTVKGIDILNGVNDKVYYNSVNLTGTVIVTVGTASAFYSGNATAIDIRNNVFSINASSPVAAHFYAHQATGNYTGSTLDYNLLYANGTGNAITNVALGLATLADWRTYTAQEAHSRSAAVQFTSATDLHIAGTSLGDWANLTGTPIANFGTDIDGDPRNAVYPYMGADENTGAPLPVKLVSFAATVAGNDVLLSWSTAQEIGNKGFNIQRSYDGRSFKAIGFAKGKGNTSVTSNYRYTDEGAFAPYTGTIYYRLQQVDDNGKETVTEIVSVSKDQQVQLAVTAYPNPVADALYLDVHARAAGQALISITDITGKTMYTASKPVMEGNNILGIEQTSTLNKGIYFVTVEVNNTKQTIKIAKR